IYLSGERGAQGTPPPKPGSCLGRERGCARRLRIVRTAGGYECAAFALRRASSLIFRAKRWICGLWRGGFEPNATTNDQIMIQTLEWTDNGVRFLDQTKLPTEEVYVTCKTHEQVADVIRNMVVRGAPAIGVATAMGIALAVKNSKAENVGDLKKEFDQACEI